MDDIECTAERIWAYLSEYAAAEPKSKEATTAALSLAHDNCGLIVNALVKAGAIREIGRNQYQAASLSEAKRKRVFESLATDEILSREFRWKCYQISYLCVYYHLTGEDTRRLEWRRIKQEWGFWLGVTGVVLGLLNLLLRCLSWWYPQ